MAQRLPPGDILFGNRARHLAHAPEVIRTLGDANRAARIQHIKQMAALQHIIISGDQRITLQRAGALALVGVEDAAQCLDIGDIKIIAAMLNFIAEHHIAIIDAIQPVDFPSRFFPLQRQHDALNAVSDLNADGVEVHAARLLEIGELRDLLPIQPDFPAQPPSAQSRRLPVVLDEANIMLALIDAQRLQRSQIKLLRIARIGLEDHLILVILLHAIRVLAKAAVIGAH